jgi:hypothetical protein
LSPYKRQTPDACVDKLDITFANLYAILIRKSLPQLICTTARDFDQNLLGAVALVVQERRDCS